ncbi:MAG: YdiU family protein [Alphaproteobacteria bacterium]|nr:YdiU family protein [Alphaproteobacteria bacterium]
MYKPRQDFRSLGDAAGAPFFDVVTPASFPASVLRYRNDAAAASVGLDNLSNDAWIAHFARFEPLPGNIQAPLAIRYHGHQFRAYNPDIGDGRGFLFAQVEDDRGRLLDLATKGSGRTPYSRSGDGRLTLKGAVREVLATEMLEALGVNTSKSFSVIETGEALERQDEPSPTRSAVLVRLGHSHVRFGAFQRLAFEENAKAVDALCGYCIDHFYPELSGIEDGGARISAFFARIVERTAALAAQWMAAGFVHGVLNTDNMNVTGESFDYGPWRFLPTVDFGFTAAYFDHTGLYAYGRQPDAAAWNLSRLGGALSLVAPEDKLNDAMRTFAPTLETGMADAFARRLGVASIGDDPKAGFENATALLTWMQMAEAPFQQVFHDWFCGVASAHRRRNSPLRALYDGPNFTSIRSILEAAAPDRPDRLEADYFDRPSPCDMLIDDVEAIWSKIADADDWGAFEAKLANIRAMKAALDIAR